MSNYYRLKKMSKWHGGKGSAQRPTDKDKFDSGWEKAFGSKLRRLQQPDNDKVLESKTVQTVPEQTCNLSE